MDPMNPNKPNQAPNCVHDKKTEKDTSERSTATVSGRQVSPLPAGQYVPSSSGDIAHSLLAERGVTQPVGDPKAFAEASQQAMAYDCMAYSLALMGCQPLELQGMYHLVYQPSANQPFINLSTGAQNENVGLWCQYQQQADVIQQYNQQILYGLLNNIELQKQQILRMAVASQIPPSIELMHMAMPSVVWPQPVYLPHLHHAITAMPSRWQFSPQIQMLGRSSHPWTLTPPSISMPAPQAFDATGFYAIPQFGAQFNGITNPLYEPWLNHMEPWIECLNQGRPVDPAAFFQHSQQPLVTPGVLNAPHGEQKDSLHGANSWLDGASQQIPQFSNKIKMQQSPSLSAVTPEQNKPKKEGPVKLKAEATAQPHKTEQTKDKEKTQGKEKSKYEQELPPKHQNTKSKVEELLPNKIKMQQSPSLSAVTIEKHKLEKEETAKLKAEVNLQPQEIEQPKYEQKSPTSQQNTKPEGEELFSNKTNIHQSPNLSDVTSKKHKLEKDETAKLKTEASSQPKKTEQLKYEQELPPLQQNTKPKDEKYSSTDKGHKRGVSFGAEHQIQYSIPAINTEKWISVARDIPLLLTNDRDKFSSDGAKCCYARELPIIPKGLASVDTNLEAFAETPSFEVNQDISVETAVDVITEFKSERELEEGFAAAASNVKSEADMVPNHLKTKPKRWTDFIETDPKVIAQFQEQVKNAGVRRQQKRYDGFYSLWSKGDIRAGPDNNEYDVLVSEEAAKKYHEIFFPGTPLGRYKKDEPCLLSDNSIAQENMHFDNILEGFVLIEDKENKKVYLCYNESYCHENSTSKPRKSSNTRQNTVPGLVPELSVCKNVGGKDALVVQGESSYDFLNPSNALPESIKPLMVKYGTEAAKMLSSNTGWALQPHPYKQLDNPKSKLVSCKSSKIPRGTKFKFISDLDFMSSEAVMQKDVSVIKDLAMITSKLTIDIVRNGFSNDHDLINNIEQLLDEDRMRKNFTWLDDENDGNKTYCNALNESSQTSGAALRQYQISRRLVNGLLAILEYPSSLQSFKSYIQILCSMEDVKTDLNTDDYESFYHDPQGNPTEGNRSCQPQDSIPVITDYRSRGGLVVKPFDKYEITRVSAFHQEATPSYLAPALNQPVVNFGDHLRKVVAVDDPNTANGWLPMSYNPHAHSLEPMLRDAYGDCGLTDYDDYLEKATGMKSKVLVHDEKSSKKPRKVSTTATHDLLGSGGLNIMHWPGMRYCSLHSPKDSSEWSALLAEETELLRRYKQLTPAQRNIVFELTMASSNAKRQPGTNPERIKECLDAAIYLTEIAYHDANGSDENAAKGLHHIRHLMHINTPRECKTVTIDGSSRESFHRMVAYIKAHDNPKEGYHALQQNLKYDRQGGFLRTGNLEANARQMQEKGNTFIHQSMQYSMQRHPFYMDERGLVEAKNYDGRGNIDIKEAVPFVSNMIKNINYNQAKTLKELQQQVAKSPAFLYAFNGSVTSANLAEWIGTFYLTNSKVQQITKTGSTDDKLDIDSLFKLDGKLMDKESEKILLDDCKKDFKELSALRGIQGADSDTLRLKMSRISGASAIPFHDKHGRYDSASVTSIECAKAIATRVLSTAMVRPPSHTCIEGIAKLTETDDFHKRTTEDRLKIIQYTTAALLQEDCSVNNLMDFSMWEMLEHGSAAHPDKLRQLESHREDLFSRAFACEEISSTISKFTKKYGDRIEDLNMDIKELNMNAIGSEKVKVELYKKLTAIGEEQEVKDFITYMNKSFEGLNLNFDNLYQKVLNNSVLRTIDGTGSIKWQEYYLYPDADNGVSPRTKISAIPITEEGKKFNVKIHYPPEVSVISGVDTIGYRMSRLVHELSKTGVALRPIRTRDFPSESLCKLFIAELETLRAQGIYLSLQGLQAAIIDITCNNEAACISLALENKQDELKKLVSDNIQKQVKISEEKKTKNKNLYDEFLNDFSNEKIVKCINALHPIRDQEKCLALSNIVSSSTKTEESEAAAYELNQIKEKNGIKCPSDDLKIQINTLNQYTLEVIEQGADAIAKNYRELLRSSNGSKDDQLKVLAMINMVFALKYKPPKFPKPEQIAAVIAIINSDSSSIAIAAEPGSGKSAYITPALIFIQQLRNKGKNFPIYVTNNEVLLQQDVDNFRHWGKAFNIPVLKLDANFEGNLGKYTNPCALVFGTSETVMGDSLRLDSMDMAERIGKDHGMYKARGRCSDALVMQLQEDGFNRAVVIDEYDTVKDRDSAGALIISKNSTKPADNCGKLSYDAYFSVLNNMENRVSYKEFKEKVIEYLVKESSLNDTGQVAIELSIAKEMTDDDWNKRFDSLIDFVVHRAKKYRLNETYAIGYEVEQTGSLSKRRIIAISNPTQENIKKIQVDGYNVKIYPINKTASEMVKNASFSNNGSNYLSYFHGLPLAPLAQTVTSSVAQDFFETKFADDGVYTLTATYGSGAMRDELIPKGRTNICFQSPYKLNLTEYPAQFYANKINMYDSAINLAYQYIEEGKDVILMSSNLDDTFALDAALNIYKNKVEDASNNATIVTLANLERQPDHEVFASKVRDLNQPFGVSHQRKKGYIINSTDASARGFNYDAYNAVLISIDCPPGERADLQKKRRVARNGRPGTVHNLMTMDAMPDYSCSTENINPYTGLYCKESQEKFKDQLEIRDSSIANQASIRRKLYEVISSYEPVFQLYYQKLMVLRSCKDGRLKGLDGLLSSLRDVITEVSEDDSMKAMDAWHKWRDDFLFTGMRNAKTPEEADKFILEQIMHGNSFRKLQDTLPFYQDISAADYTSKDEIKSVWARFCNPVEEEDNRLIDISRRLGNCLYKRQCQADYKLNKMYQRMSGAA